jgi:hypothetical protein
VDTVADELAAFGAPAELVDSYKRKEPKHFAVFRENWLAVKLFMKLQTQWVVSGMGTPVGLHYPSVEVLFRIYKIKNTRRMLEKIRLIEQGALQGFAERAASTAKGKKNGP